MNIYDFGQWAAERYGPNSYKFAREIRRKQKEAICLFCDKQLKMHTSKKDYTYLSNYDLSPHRKGYICVNNREEYNGP